MEVRNTSDLKVQGANLVENSRNLHRERERERKTSSMKEDPKRQLRTLLRIVLQGSLYEERGKLVAYYGTLTNKYK